MLGNIFNYDNQRNFDYGHKDFYLCQVYWMHGCNDFNLFSTSKSKHALDASCLQESILNCLTRLSSDFMFSSVKYFTLRCGSQTVTLGG